MTHFLHMHLGSSGLQFDDVTFNERHRDQILQEVLRNGGKEQKGIGK